MRNPVNNIISSIDAWMHRCIHGKALVLASALALFLFVFSSCDIFDHRDAERPTEPKSNFNQAVEPQDVLTNLINSLQDKDVENYLACFSDSNFSGKRFLFSPSAGAASQFPALADMWDKRNEEQYFNSLKTRIPENVRIELTLTNPDFNQLDSVIYTASYTLTVPHNDPSIPTNYQGELRFSMARDIRSVWSIYYWQDIKRDNNPSWSELKGRFY